MKTIKDIPEHSRPQEKLIVTKKGYFSFQEAGLIR
jgi:hypothetical protein